MYVIRKYIKIKSLKIIFKSQVSDIIEKTRNSEEPVLNADETGFQILPTSIRTWAFKNAKNVSINVSDNDKERISIMATISSDFKKLPLFIITKAKDQDDAEIFLAIINKFKDIDKNLIKNIFTISSQIITHDISSNDETVRSEKIFSLDIVQKNNSSINQELLNCYNKDVQITSDSKQKNLIIKTKDILVIHINRSIYNRRMGISKKEILNFTIDNEITIYNCFDKINHKYMLFGSIIHSGSSLNRGHFFTLLKFIDNGNFVVINFNDSKVTEITESSFSRYINGNPKYSSDCAILAFYVKESEFKKNSILQ